MGGGGEGGAGVGEGSAWPLSRRTHPPNPPPPQGLLPRRAGAGAAWAAAHVAWLAAAFCLEHRGWRGGHATAWGAALVQCAAAAETIAAASRALAAE